MPFFVLTNYDLICEASECPDHDTYHIIVVVEVGSTFSQLFCNLYGIFGLHISYLLV